MTQRSAARLAWSLAGLTLAMIAASLLLPTQEELLFFLVFFPVFLTGFALTGALIASRHPRNAIGWIFLGTGLVWASASLASGIASYALEAGMASSDWARLADWTGAWLFTPGIFVPVTFLFLLFPDGRLLSIRWRPVARISALAVLGMTLSSAFAPGPLEDTAILRSNPYAFGGRLWEAVGLVSFFTAFLGMLAGVGALIVRLRRSEGEARQQLKWLAYGSVVVAVLFAIAGIGWGVLRDEVAAIVGPIVVLVALLLIPLAAGVAILRYRLYDIDVVINRTVVYGVLAAFVTLVYVAIVVGIGALIGSRDNLLLSIVATALIAVAFQPMRDRSRRLANRLVYGKRATPYEVMSEFADRVAGTYSLDEVLPRMATIAADGTGADRVEVWVRIGRDLRLEAWWPTDGQTRTRWLPVAENELPSIPGMDAAIPVTHQNEVLGAIAVAMPRTEALTPAGEKLLADLASQAGLVLRNVRLIEELRASRQRLVAAQDDERRRLERNIHDGAQQQLVALSVKLRLARTLAGKDPAKAEALLEELQTENQDALENLRDLARGIYPPLLADQGLAAALEAQARKAAVPVIVEPDGVGRYPQEVEAGAYFCVLEALQNVAKYAGASRVTVQIGTEDGALVFEVRDDGSGFDPLTTSRGSGLQNMTDRVEALGGTLEIVSAPGAGTRVRGRIPAQPRAADQASASRSGSNSDLGM